MQIKFHHIQANSLVDGPGKRTVVFLQGCDLHCAGCQNKTLWNPDGGQTAEVADLAKALLELSSATGNVTISGGEPFMQVKALTELVKILKDAGRHIIVYTGHTWEGLLSCSDREMGQNLDVLHNVDVVVDGPFIASRDDDLITWRGSRNQRPIDVQATIYSAYPVSRPIVLDWDSPELILDEQGNLTLPVGLAQSFAPLGEIESSRMCGEVVKTCLPKA